MPAERGPAFPHGKSDWHTVRRTRALSPIWGSLNSRKLGPSENAGLERSNVVNASGLTPKVA